MGMSPSALQCYASKVSSIQWDREAKLPTDFHEQLYYIRIEVYCKNEHHATISNVLRRKKSNPQEYQNNNLQSVDKKMWLKMLYAVEERSAETIARLCEPQKVLV